MQLCATGNSRAGIAAVVFAVFLAGCGGSESSSSASSFTGTQTPSTETGTQTPSTETESQTPAVEAPVAKAQSVSLSWLAPGERINGEQLSYTDDIGGYIVLYGQDPENLDQQVEVECSALNCGYEVENLSAGTWYFAVQTVDSSGLVSAPSEPVSRSI